MFRLIIAAVATTLAALGAFAPAARAAAPVCPTIEFAALQAVGAKHGSAQYVVYLKSADASLRTVAFTVGFEGTRMPMPLTVSLGRSSSMFGRKDPSILFLMPHADVAWMRVVGTMQGSSHEHCASARYALKETKIEAPMFDDSVSWAHPYAIMQFAGAGQTSVLGPENAAVRGMSGSSRVVAVVGADGIVKDAAVLETSGDTAMDEAAVKAVTETRFSAAHLPGSAGGKTIPSIVDLSVTFTPGMVSVHIH